MFVFWCSCTVLVLCLRALEGVRDGSEEFVKSFDGSDRPVFSIWGSDEADKSDKSVQSKVKPAPQNGLEACPIGMEEPEEQDPGMEMQYEAFANSVVDQSVDAMKKKCEEHTGELAADEDAKGLLDDACAAISGSCPTAGVMLMASAFNKQASDNLGNSSKKCTKEIEDIMIKHGENYQEKSLEKFKAFVMPHLVGDGDNAEHGEALIGLVICAVQYQFVDDAAKEEMRSKMIKKGLTVTLKLLGMTFPPFSTLVSECFIKALDVLWAEGEVKEESIEDKISGIVQSMVDKAFQESQLRTATIYDSAIHSQLEDLEHIDQAIEGFDMAQTTKDMTSFNRLAMLEDDLAIASGLITPNEKGMTEEGDSGEFSWQSLTSRRQFAGALEDHVVLFFLVIKKSLSKLKIPELGTGETITKFVKIGEWNYATLDNADPHLELDDKTLTQPFEHPHDTFLPVPAGWELVDDISEIRELRECDPSVCNASWALPFATQYLVFANGSSIGTRRNEVYGVDDGMEAHLSERNGLYAPPVDGQYGAHYRIAIRQRADKSSINASAVASAGVGMLQVMISKAMRMMISMAPYMVIFNICSNSKLVGNKLMSVLDSSSLLLEARANRRTWDDQAQEIRSVESFYVDEYWPDHGKSLFKAASVVLSLWLPFICPGSKTRSSGASQYCYSDANANTVADFLLDFPWIGETYDNKSKPARYKFLDLTKRKHQQGEFKYDQEKDFYSWQDMLNGRPDFQHYRMLFYLQTCGVDEGSLSIAANNEYQRKDTKMPDESTQECQLTDDHKKKGEEGCKCKPGYYVKRIVLEETRRLNLNSKRTKYVPTMATEKGSFGTCVKAEDEAVILVPNTHFQLQGLCTENTIVRVEDPRYKKTRYKKTSRKDFTFAVMVSYRIETPDKDSADSRKSFKVKFVKSTCQMAYRDPVHFNKQTLQLAAQKDRLRRANLANAAK